MTTREQLTNERLEALIEVLAEQGVIGREWADSLESTRQIGDGRETAAAAREGRPPPDHSGDQQ